MTTFVLVHGGAHGAWCWSDCASHLEQLGHHAVSFDLPGHGHDATPRGKVRLDDYAAAIRTHLKQTDDCAPVLVGHSLAGIAIARALEHDPAPIERLILVAALVLKRGEKGIDQIPESRRQMYVELAEASPERSINLTPGMSRNLFFHDLDDARARHFQSLLTPQPLAIYLDPCRFDLSALSCPRHYLACRNDQALGLETSMKFSDRLGGSLDILEAGHDVMLSQPEQLARCLIAQTGTQPRRS